MKNATTDNATDMAAAAADHAAIGGNRRGYAAPDMPMGVGYETALCKKFDFRGRASRSEFCGAVWLTLGLIALWNIILTGLFGEWVIVEWLILGGYVALRLPTLAAVSVRRMHDHNWSGWWALLMLPGMLTLLSIALGGLSVADPTALIETVLGERVGKGVAGILLLAQLMSLSFLVYAYCKSGNPERNRYNRDDEVSS